MLLRIRQRQKDSPRWQKEPVMKFMACPTTWFGTSTQTRSLATHRFKPSLPKFSSHGTPAEVPNLFISKRPIRRPFDHPGGPDRRQETRAFVWSTKSMKPWQQGGTGWKGTLVDRQTYPLSMMAWHSGFLTQPKSEFWGWDLEILTLLFFFYCLMMNKSYIPPYIGYFDTTFPTDGPPRIGTGLKEQRHSLRALGL